MANRHNDRNAPNRSYQGPDLDGYGRDYDRSRDWPGSLDNVRENRGLGDRRGYLGGADYDENFGGRDFGLEFDRGYGGRDYPHRGDTGRDFDRGYGARDDHRYELTFEHGYGAWDAVRNRNAAGPPSRRGSQAPEGQHRGHGPQGYRRSDERIEEDANERLTQHGALDARNIRVKVEGGAITLEGTVGSRRYKRMAEAALATITGVQDIHNHLRVEAPEQVG